MTEETIASTQPDVDVAAIQEVNGLRSPDITRPLRDYKVGPGDLLTIVVWDHPELTNPFGAVTHGNEDPGIEVSSSGEIFFPYCGVLKVEGLSVFDIRKLLSVELGKITRSPQVGVKVSTYRAQRVQVTGEVLQPGIVALDNTDKGVIEAISERGGLTPVASRRRIVLIRQGKRYAINTRLLYAGDVGSINPALEPGDIIHVPDGTDDQVLVLGEVPLAKPLSLGDGGLSALQAVTAAGGLTPTSADGGAGLIVFRPVTTTTAENTVAVSARVFILDLSKPQGIVLASQFELGSRDVVYVKATGLSKYNSVISQILPTIESVYFTYRVVGGK